MPPRRLAFRALAVALATPLAARRAPRAAELEPVAGRLDRASRRPGLAVNGMAARGALVLPARRGTPIARTRGASPGAREWYKTAFSAYAAACFVVKARL